MENIAQIQGFTALAVGIIFGMGALGTAIGFGRSAASSWKAPRASRN